MASTFRHGALPALVLLSVLIGDGRTSSAAVSDAIRMSREIFRQPCAALMWPGATRSFLITSIGSLDNGEWETRLDPATDDRPAEPPQAIEYRHDAIPIA